MLKRVKIFSDADELELEKEINSFLKTSGAEIIDTKLSVSQSEEGAIHTVALTVEIDNEINYE